MIYFIFSILKCQKFGLYSIKKESLEKYKLLRCYIQFYGLENLFLPPCTFWQNRLMKVNVIGGFLVELIQKGVDISQLVGDLWKQRSVSHLVRLLYLRHKPTQIELHLTVQATQLSYQVSHRLVSQDEKQVLKQKTQTFSGWFVQAFKG